MKVKYDDAFFYAYFFFKINWLREISTYIMSIACVE
jgi:hypothetical protein